MSVFFEISSYPSWEMLCHLFLSVRSSAFLMLGMNVERADHIAPTIGRQWKDVLGILKRQGAPLDLGYLARRADVLDVRDQLERALVGAGLRRS